MSSVYTRSISHHSDGTKISTTLYIILPLNFLGLYNLPSGQRQLIPCHGRHDKRHNFADGNQCSRRCWLLCPVAIKPTLLRFSGYRHYIIQRSFVKGVQYFLLTDGGWARYSRLIERYHNSRARSQTCCTSPTSLQKQIGVYLP
jgi:hypothetical protein